MSVCDANQPCFSGSFSISAFKDHKTYYIGAFNVTFELSKLVYEKKYIFYNDAGSWCFFCL